MHALSVELDVAMTNHVVAINTDGKNITTKLKIHVSDLITNVYGTWTHLCVKYEASAANSDVHMDNLQKREQHICRGRLSYRLQPRAPQA